MMVLHTKKLYLMITTFISRRHSTFMNKLLIIG